MAGVDDARQQQAAQAHAAHEDAEQDAERNGRRAYRELKELEPDNFIYEGRAAGSDKKQKKRRQPAAVPGPELPRELPYQIESSCAAIYQTRLRVLLRQAWDNRR